MWTFEVGTNYTLKIIQDCIKLVLGDYRYTNTDINFIRCDADPKFVGHEKWLQMLGIRFYVAPTGVKTSRAERTVRTTKETVRTICNSLLYRPPVLSRQWHIIL